jgi:hypothetical protein
MDRLKAVDTGNIKLWIGPDVFHAPLVDLSGFLVLKWRSLSFLSRIVRAKHAWRSGTLPTMWVLRSEDVFLWSSNTSFVIAG